MKTGRLSYGALITLSLSIGCGGEAQVQVQTQTITAKDLRTLGAGEMITVHAEDTETVHIFDHRAGPIDLQRVNLICPNGDSLTLGDWLEAPADAPKCSTEPQDSSHIAPVSGLFGGCFFNCIDEDGERIACGHLCARTADHAWYMDDRLAVGDGWPRQGPEGPKRPTPPDDEGNGNPGPGTADPNDEGRPSEGGSGSTGGSGSSGSGGSTGNPPGGHGSAGGHGGTGGTGGGGGGLF